MDQQIIDNDKLIAEFMEFMPYENTHYQCKIHNSDEIILPTHNMKFDKDWNWLMPVVEKIEKLDYDVKLSTYYITIAKFNTIIQVFGGNRIKLTHKAVVKFIKWYNKQGKK